MIRRGKGKKCLALFRRERGAILGLALIIAFLASLAAYTLLSVAASQAMHGRFHREHASARHAAEAGLVSAYQQLVTSNGAYCGTNTQVINGMTVTVTVTCGAPNTVTAGVVY